MFNELVDQMQSNNIQIESLLKLVDNLRYDNSQIIRRLRIPEETVGSRNVNTRSDNTRNTVETRESSANRRSLNTRNTLERRETSGATGATANRRSLHTRNTLERRDATGATANRRNVNTVITENVNRNNLEEDYVFYFYLPRREEARREDPPEPLSQETISQETTRCLFNEIENPNNLTCPISLETFQPEQSVSMINQCRHIFNTDHLIRWFETRSTCPMCRCNIQSTEIPPINRLASMATQMFSNAITSGVNDILNDLRI